MLYYAQLFANYMDAKGIKYTERDERTLKVSYSGENKETITIFAFFDKDGDPVVQFKCWEICNFKNAIDKGMAACNKLNYEYRWVKFYIDGDGDIIADVDAMLDDATCGATCLTQLRRMVSIIDDVYPTFAKARWA